MQQVCKALTFPDKVAAAALLFFKRFYLKFSSLDHDPKNIMLTCIYLACKVSVLHRHHCDCKYIGGVTRLAHYWTSSFC